MKCKCVGVIAAMNEEAAAIIELLHPISTSVESIAGATFTKAVMKKGGSVIIGCSGIGKANAAAATACMIDHYHPDAVMSLGVAGGFKDFESVLDVIVADSLVYTDVDIKIEAFNVVPGQLVNTDPVFYASKELIEVVRGFEGQGNTIRYGRVGSGDQFIIRQDPARISYIQSTFPEVICVEMEGAAIAHICSKCSVPFLFMKCLSDNPTLEAQTAEVFGQNLMKASAIAGDLGVKVILKLIGESE
jgi:adenosylhomocysteine nucleosidase